MTEAWFYFRSVVTTWKGILAWSGVIFTLMLAGERRWPRLASRIQRGRKPVEVLFLLSLFVSPFLVWRGQRSQDSEALRAARDSIAMRARCCDSLRMFHAASLANQERVARLDRDRKIDHLGELIAEGNPIKAKCIDGPYRPVDDADRWKARVRAYIQRALGPAYLIRFDQAPSGGDPGVLQRNGRNVQMLELWSWVDGKQACLTEFVRELQQAPQ